MTLSRPNALRKRRSVNFVARPIFGCCSCRRLSSLSSLFSLNWLSCACFRQCFFSCVLFMAFKECSRSYENYRQWKLTPTFAVNINIRRQALRPLLYTFVPHVRSAGVHHGGDHIRLSRFHQREQVSCSWILRIEIYRKTWRRTWNASALFLHEHCMDRFLFVFRAEMIWIQTSNGRKMFMLYLPFSFVWMCARRSSMATEVVFVLIFFVFFLFFCV